MLIGRDDISNDVITLGMCFSMFVYIHARFCFMLIGGNLTAQSTGSHRGIGGGIQIPEGHSWKLSFLFPPGELACRLVASSLNTVLYPNLTAMHLVQQAIIHHQLMRETRLTNPAVRDCNFKAEPLLFPSHSKRKKKVLLTG